jgi:hypothetical protein
MQSQVVLPNEEESTQIRSLREQDWARRKKKIEEEQSNAVSTPWYLMAWSFCTGLATSIQQSFQSVDFLKMFYPDNPGTKEIFSNVGFSILPTIVKFISPVALGLSWVKAGLAIKRFAKAENKNIWEYSNLAFSIAAPAIWTSLFVAGVVVSTAALAPVLPWVAVGVFGLFAVKGIFDCGTNCYRAWKAHRAGDKKARNEYLKQAGKNLIGIVFNTLALTVSVFLGVKMTEAANQMADAIDYFKKTFSFDKLDAAMENISAIFSKGCGLLAALTGTAVVGVLANNAKRIANTNKELWNAVCHPINTIKSGWNTFKARPVAAVAKAVVGIIKLPLRVVAFVFAPIQLAFLGVQKLFGKKTSQTASAVVAPAVSVAPTIEKSQASLLTQCSSLSATSALSSTSSIDERKVSESNFSSTATPTSSSVIVSAKIKEMSSSSAMLRAKFAQKPTLKEVYAQAESFYEKLGAKIAGYEELIARKYNNQMSQVPSRVKAKLALLKRLHKNEQKESVDAIVVNVKNNVKTGKGDASDFDGSVVFHSMFKHVGEVKALVEEARHIEEVCRVAAPAA